MNKYVKKFIKTFLLLISIINLSINIEAMPKENISIPNHIKIDVEDKILNTVEYDNFYLDAQRINTSIGPGYCLEVEKDYPSGQTFKFVGKPAKQVVGMMANGYPNKTPLEIGVDTEDNAYFATQVAIWCVTEGYSPYKFKSKDKQLLKAIENIYEQGIEYKGNELDHVAMEYYFNNCIQRIVIYINKEIEKCIQLPYKGNHFLFNYKKDLYIITEQFKDFYWYNSERNRIEDIKSDSPLYEMERNIKGSNPFFLIVDSNDGLFLQQVQSGKCYKITVDDYYHYQSFHLKKLESFKSDLCSEIFGEYLWFCFDDFIDCIKILDNGKCGCKKVNDWKIGNFLVEK